MDTSPEERARRIEERATRIVETLEVARGHIRETKPSAADIVARHELHARHERSDGRDERANAAEERARHARNCLVPEPAPPGRGV
jgi:hypothetical protein